MSAAVLLFTIYERPRDYPNAFVVRRFEVVEGTILKKELLGLASSLEAVRALLPQGVYNLGRHENDDPCIVETWI